MILRALKKHGMVLADNGSSLFMSGVPDPSWNNNDLNALRGVPGSAFEAVDVSSLEVSSASYAVTGGAPPPPPPPPAELLANTGFEADLTGWTRSDKRTTLARTCSVAHGGTCAAQLGRTRTGDALLDDSPNSVASTPAGSTYDAVAWVRAPAGRTVTLRLTERSGSAVVRTSAATTTGTGAWRQLVLTSAGASGGTSLSLEVVVSLVRGATAQVDDLSLKRG